MKYVAVVQNYWGSGDTPKEAEANVRRESGYPYASFKARVMYYLDEGFQISEIDGSVSAASGKVVERFIGGVRTVEKKIAFD